MKIQRLPVYFALMMGALVLTGCPPKKKLPIAEKPAEVKPDQAAEDEAAKKAAADKAAADEAARAVKIAQDWTEIPALQVVNFAYDAATLDDSARTTLKKNVGVLKKLPGSVVVRVEGHCDDRGTVEYNIALGQRRANAVRSYYVTAGIPKTRVESISFGEERPVCTQETEDCWAQNRRGATKVKNSTPLSLNPDDLQ